MCSPTCTDPAKSVSKEAVSLQQHAAKAASIVKIVMDALLAPLAILFPSALTTRARASVALACMPSVLALLLRYSPTATQGPFLYYAWWTLTALVGAGILALVAFGCFFASVVVRNRQAANPTALQAHERQLHHGRLVQGDGYDVYLPAKQPSSSQAHVAGMVFVPGALVAHHAYAGVLSQLADQGIVTVVLSLDPLRMPVPFGLATPRGIASVLKQIETRHGVRAQKWTLAGHSAGGNAVANVVREQKLPGMHRLVLWGVNTTQDLEQHEHVQALCITASNDGFKGNSMGRGLPSFDSWKDLGSRLQHVEIQGGNHGGFGDYPPQTFPRKDGAREIPLAEQHKQIVQATSEFLLSKED